MKNKISKAARIRERNQLTIPWLIVQSLDWIKENAFVNLEANKGEIIIKPLLVKKIKRKRKLNEKEWKKIFKSLKNIRRSGKQDVDLASFIAKDRLAH